MTSERRAVFCGRRCDRITTRRSVLGGMVGGGVLVSMPAFLAGCGVQQAIEPAAVPPANPFLASFGVDEAMLSRVFAALAPKGADTADIYFQHRRQNVLEMQDGVITESDSSILQGVGLRVVTGERTGFAFTEELTAAAMERAARVAVDAAAGKSRVPPQAFTTAPAGGLYVVEVPWPDVANQRKQALLESIDRQARAADPAVDSVSVSWLDADERILIATLDGRLVGDERPMTRVSVRVSANRNGRREWGFANVAARAGIAWYDEARIDALAREAVDRALVRFEATDAPTGDMPVILSAGTSGILLHEAIGHAFEADFALSGASRYAGRMGQPVAGPGVTLVDQATLAAERGALNYDDEGTKTGRTVLVDSGVLRSWLHDTTTARRAGVAPTGSARRESYRFAPLPRMSCTFIESGPFDREEIIASVDRGVLAETYTTGRVTLGEEGAFNFSVDTGWLVENGRITAPLSDFTIAGTGADTLAAMTMVANDGRMDRGGWTCGKKGQQVPVSHGMPTVLVSSLAVSGDPES